MVEFEFVRATENAALHSLQWMGCGDKEAADAAASDAIRGMFDLVDIRGEVVIGEGIKDNAPGIFLGERLGRWGGDDPRFDIAVDPIDGTSNISKGMPNSISVMAASFVPDGVRNSMTSIPSFYAEKVAFGPRMMGAIADGTVPSITLDLPFEETLRLAARALGKRIGELVVTVLDRPRNLPYITAIRTAGASLRLISDGDITAAVAPSLHESGIDLYAGIGGATEGVLTAAALKALGGQLLLRMWPRDEEERHGLLRQVGPQALGQVHSKDDLVRGNSAIFCATGISDSPLLPGLKLLGKTVMTHSILMSSISKTVRYVRAVHDLEVKTIHLHSLQEEEHL